MNRLEFVVRHGPLRPREREVGEVRAPSRERPRRTRAVRRAVPRPARLTT